MSNKREPPNQLGDILNIFETTLGDMPGPVAIGLDMAAQEDNWGLCVLVLDEELQRARLCTLVPQAKLNANHSRSPTLLFRPSLKLVATLLAGVRDKSDRFGSLAVDTPFGWSCPQNRFLTGWSAVEGWQPPRIKWTPNYRRRRYLPGGDVTSLSMLPSQRFNRSR